MTEETISEGSLPDVGDLLIHSVTGEVVIVLTKPSQELTRKLRLIKEYKEAPWRWWCDVLWLTTKHRTSIELSFDIYQSGIGYVCRTWRWVKE